MSILPNERLKLASDVSVREVCEGSSLQTRRLVARALTLS